MWVVTTPESRQPAVSELAFAVAQAAAHAREGVTATISGRTDAVAVFRRDGRLLAEPATMFPSNTLVGQVQRLLDRFQPPTTKERA